MQPRMVPTLMVLALLCSGADPTVAADPEIDRLLQAPVGKDWVTNGGNPHKSWCRIFNSSGDGLGGPGRRGRRCWDSDDG